MAGIVVLKAGVSGGVAGLTAIAVTLLVERFGGDVGGILGTVPTSIVPSAIGIRLQRGDDDFRTSMYTIPLGMVLNSGFLSIWRTLPPLLPRRWSWITSLIVMITVSLLYWLVSATCVYWLLWGLKERGINLLWLGIGALCFNALAGFCLVTFLPVPAPKGSKKVTWPVVLARGVLAFLAVSAAVGISATNNVVAGIVSTFPAIFLTTMVSLCVSQGNAVATGTTGPMILGSICVSSFALSLAYALPYFVRRTRSLVGGIASSVVFIWIGCVLCISVPLFFYVKWCRSRMPPAGAPLVGQGGSNQLTGSADDRPGLQMMPSGVWNKPNI